MNAGAHGGQLSDVVETVATYGLRGAGPQELPAAAAGFGYRHTDLDADAVVTGA